MSQLAQPRDFAAFSLQSLDGTAPFYVPGNRLIEVAAWMRHAAHVALAPVLPPAILRGAVLGHGPREERQEHMMFVPLPSLCGSSPAETDGAIQTVMFIPPSEHRKELLGLLNHLLPGRQLVGISSGIPPLQTPICTLAPLEARSGELIARYLYPAAHWQTVTPFLLHGHQTMRGIQNAHKIERMLLIDLARSGVAQHEVAAICFQQESFWGGTQPADCIRIPLHLKKWPRHHVQIHLHSPTSGPLICGIGKFYGLGIFAPVVKGREPANGSRLSSLLRR